MKFSPLFLFSALFGFAFGEIPVEDGVLVLGEDNFEEATSTHSQMLVEFYAPWCGHCKALAPEWVKAAKALASSPMKLAKVDATEHKDLASTFEIRGFPTIKYFKNGKASDYSGGRTESEIVKWVNKKAGPSYATLNNEDELLKHQEANEVFALGVFSSIDSDAAKAFIELANNDEDHLYAVATDASVSSKLGLTGDHVVVLKTFDDLRNDLAVSGDFDSEAVAEFIAGNSVPLIQEFSPEAAKKIFSSPITKHVLFFTDKAEGHHATTVELFSSVAKNYKGKALFVNVPSSEDKVMGFFGVKADAVPAVVVADLKAEGGIKKFPYTGALESAPVSEFLESFFAGSLKPTLKSEKREAADTTGDVVVLRGESFKELVMDNDKDVFVEFYAPWCGHCKNLAPTWDALGAKYKGSSQVTIAKMDATANEIDVPGVGVKGFPTIYFFKGNDKSNPVKYDKARELDDFVKYLEENGSHDHHDHDEL